MNLFRLWLFVLLMSLLKSNAQNTYVVNTTNDHTWGNHPGELRWAINEAANHPGSDNIHFNIPGNPPHVINLTSNLPFIHGGIVIDGSTQPGSTPNPLDKKIHIVGNSNTTIVLSIQPYENIPSTIKDLVIANGAQVVTFFYSYSHSNVFTGNIVYNKNNIILGYSSLVEFQGKNNLIKGNVFGTDHTFSTSSIFNCPSGLNFNYFDGVGCIATNTIGGLLSGEGNSFYNIKTNAYSTSVAALNITSGNRNKISGNLFINNHSIGNIHLLNGNANCLANINKQKPSFYYYIVGGVATLKGNSSPNDFIEIYKSDPLWNDASVLLGTTTADAAGKFSTTISGVTQNEHLLITATDPLNNTSQFAWPCISQGFLAVSGAQCPGNTTTLTYSATPTLSNIPGTTTPITTQITYSLNYGPSPLAFGANANSGQLYTSVQPNFPVGSYVAEFIFQQPSAAMAAYTGTTCPIVTYTAPITIISCTVTPPPPPPCLDCIGSFNPKPGDTLIVSTWVKEQNVSPTKVNYNFPKLSVEYPSSSASASGPFFAKGQIIEGWQRLEEQFIVPLTATFLKIKLECLSGNCLFDDIRVFPKNGSMKSYVYDPQTMRLVAELDERNYATIYEYDEEGKLTRIKKETEKGIMTIQENKSSNSKK